MLAPQTPGCASTGAADRPLQESRGYVAALGGGAEWSSIEGVAFPLTVRQHHRRRLRLAVLFCTCGLLVTALSAARLNADAATRSLLARLLPVLGMTTFLAGIVISGSGRCPRCTNVVNPFVSLYKRCPYCGIGLDEPCR